MNNHRSQKFRLEPDLEAALIFAPIILIAGVIGFFIEGDIAFIPYIVRFLGLFIAGYMAASQFHNRWSSRASRKIFDQMTAMGMRGGFFSALIAWFVLLLFLVVAKTVDLDIDTNLLGGFLSAILDAVAGLLLGALGGWAYSKFNRPRIINR